MSIVSRVWFLGLLTVIVATAGGCAQLDLGKPVQWPWDAEEEPEVPNKVVAMWIDGMRYPHGQPATRGFIGQLLFYGDDKEKPIKVDGRLEIYAFDEDSPKGDKAKPDRKFVFTKETFAKHHTKSDLGHNYGFWLPWGPADGPQKEISLIIRFIPVDGQLVMGEQTKTMLPGNTPPPRPEHVEVVERFRSRPVNVPYPGTGQGVRPAAYQTPAQTGYEGLPPDQFAPRGPSMQQTDGPRMTVATIEVPSRMARRWPVAANRQRAGRSRITRQGIPAAEAAVGGSAPAAEAARTAAATVPPGAWAAAPASPNPAQPPVHSPLARSQVPDARAAQPGLGRGSLQPRPVTWPSHRQPRFADPRGGGFPASAPSAPTNPPAPAPRTPWGSQTQR